MFFYLFNCCFFFEFENFFFWNHNVLFFFCFFVADFQLLFEKLKSQIVNEYNFMIISIPKMLLYLFDAILFEFRFFWANRTRRPNFVFPETEFFFFSLGNWVDKNEEKILTTTRRRLDKKWHFFYALKYAVKWHFFLRLEICGKMTQLFLQSFCTENDLKSDPIFFSIFLH